MKTRYRFALSVVLSCLTLSLTSCKKESSEDGCTPGAGLHSTDILGSDLSDGQISLTFDDGPSVHTERLLDGLKKHGITASFFVIGFPAKSNLDLLERMKKEGHLVGNHTFTHPDITKSSNPVAEVMRTDEVISPYVTGDMFLFRPPFGVWGDAVAQRLNGEGLAKYVGPIHWDIGDSGTEYTSDSECWTNGKTTEECGEIFLNEIKTKRKGIVLLHDSHEKTVTMILDLIPKIKALGMEFVRLDKTPGIRSLLVAGGGKPDTIDGPASCFDY